MNFSDYLQMLADKDGSDMYITAGAPLVAKFNGKLRAIDKTPLTPEDTRRIANEIMDEDQRAEFDRKPEMNLALSLPKVGRFRVNIFRQRNAVAMVIRNIKVVIPRFEDLGLPEVLKELVMEKRGLVLFVGGTGSGKSTSLASLIDYRNANSSGHIITIEDPIEFVHSHKKSLISQREVGVDTDSYEDALKNTLRQAPDVILIGEIRERETMEHALAFAETGHLCISTLHANNANQALDRIINFFPEERRHQLLMDLSLNLKGFVSQRLIPNLSGGRVAAIEVLLGTPLVQDLILKGEIHKIKEVMTKSANVGMQTFDLALFRLLEQGQIAEDLALSNADSPTDLKLRISLSRKGGAMGSKTADGKTLSLVTEEEPDDDDTL